MGNDSWKKGVEDVRKGKGPPSPSSHKSDQARKDYEAARAAQIKKEQDARKKK